MRGCTRTDNHKIAILMAVYEPHMDWLRLQLTSLNAQDYPNLMLYVCDDCSPTVPFEEIQALVKECISSFPYIVTRNEENLGSNGTFERLTKEAEADFFAYCDQDDIWLSEKLTVLHRAITEQNALLVCSDMYIIDKDGNKTANSIKKVRRHHVFRSGEDLADGLIFRNFATGCTMLVRAESAKRAIPFCPYMVHDHYIALCCAAHGRILSLSEPLISYRIHGGNQTGLFAGIVDKETYGRIRIESMLNRLLWLRAHPASEKLCETLDIAVLWAMARKANWYMGKDKKNLWKYRRFGKLPSLFELLTARMPEWAFRALLHLVTKNIL